jgi:hypothetical protein
MPIVIEHNAQTEKVIVILRKEGEDMKPSDTQCRAMESVDDEEVRCELGITFDQEGDFWSKFCAKHNKQHRKAAVEGGPRVVKAEV